MSTAIPSTVEAIAIDKPGDFDVLEKKTLPFVNNPSNVVIKTEWLGVNFIDTYFRKGLYPLKSFPATLGIECAGTVAALPTDEAVLNDPDYQRLGLTVGKKVVGEVMGAFATYVSIPWIKVFPLPDALSTRTGAATLISGSTALSFAEEAYPIQKGDVIFVHTAAGGFGLVLTQIAKHKGATVIGTTSTEEKAKLCKGNGVDHVILYTKENTVERVKEITSGKGVNAIFDGVGKDTFEADLEMIGRKGTIVCVGNASGPVPPVAPLRLTPKNVKLVRPSQMNYLATADETYQYGQSLWTLVEQGVVKVNIFKEYPFSASGAQEAQKDLTGGKTTGKLLMKV